MSIFWWKKKNKTTPDQVKKKQVETIPLSLWGKWYSAHNISITFKLIFKSKSLNQISSRLLHFEETVHTLLYTVEAMTDKER